MEWAACAISNAKYLLDSVPSPMVRDLLGKEDANEEINRFKCAREERPKGSRSWGMTSKSGTSQPFGRGGARASGGRRCDSRPSSGPNPTPRCCWDPPDQRSIEYVLRTPLQSVVYPSIKHQDFLAVAPRPGGRQKSERRCPKPSRARLPSKTVAYLEAKVA